MQPRQLILPLCWALWILWLSAWAAPAKPAAPTWAERLGWPAGKRVILLHADDIGMCAEANQAAQRALERGEYRSASCMVPCPWFNDMAEWCKKNPRHDVGLHLTLTSEWRTYRWGPVAPRDKVRGLVDRFGYLFRDVPSVALTASPQEVALEIRAQVARARQMGLEPTHLDTHMGTLFARIEFTREYLKLAEELEIPAMVIEMTPDTIAKFSKQGYPITESSLALLREYKLPKLDDFHGVQGGAKSYEEKRQQFYAQVKSFRPGLNEIIFHPSELTEGLKRITGSWQQRAWESQLFADPEVQEFLKGEDFILTDWKEVMRRWKERRQ